MATITKNLKKYIYLYLLEGEEDGLKLALLQHIHQVADLLVAPVQLLLPLHQLLLLLGEGHVLVQGFLVDVRILLQLLVCLVQLFEELLLRHALVLVEGVGG